ncbi:MULTISPECIES: branched-chain amino acid ABC transporter substrate-binding protein [Brevibacillus]|jgi:branched-chain amino acid transport system substrate-binding protein|uniref:Branched chain amino acid ABC transporter substrate-binding protein n=1 Tax=Brevibacillus parabrevis TaxID=54914 RepID=A0A4Y3PII5_BREPA|nr:MULTISPECIES: branched-chain amino acid ABC transporter substrate-binding protein [Brevibacillus]MBU8715300.1 branched-chain amino acid ABC transporter substrate-binding protein [Brevibacillus parabrevis]MDH6352031.1 branched-chain amino acid transport system substrate-binding protein [Brevibacillus sp. 1238]MDR4999767.1 branched-chain amino acid ABC transporter substrate-binding protein [Brevibacillus parabrevis]MED1724916.1 branched-chain amino acid ABC transporter substrate-binding protei
MKKLSHISILSAVLATSVALTGCAGTSNSSGGSNTGGGGQPAQNQPSTSGSGGGAATDGGVIKIATQTPLSGNQSSLGDAIKTGAEYALNQRKEEFKKLGFDIQLFPQDDQADPKIGVSNAEMLISNPDVYGVVGHLNSGVAIPSSVKYEEGKLVMVSPANTAVKLTEEGKKTVHRICARDDAQGPKAAMYAKNTLGVKTAFIIHDKTAYGQGLSDQVKLQFEKDGVQLLGYEGITQGEKDYSAVLNQVSAKNPDIIFFGGLYPEGGILVKQAREKGYKGYFMGGDGLDSSDMIKIAGDAVEGVVFTSVAGDVTQTEEGKKWAEEYKKTTNKPLETYSVYGFDSMNVILNGVMEAIKANGGKKPTREQVLEAVHKTKDFQGQFTKVTFDEKGDNTNADVFIYKYDKDKSTFVGKAE